MRDRIAACIALTIISTGSAPAQPADDPLAPLHCILGEWRGVGEGVPGASAGERIVRRAHGRFIVSEGRSVYPRQNANPDGEVHTQTMIFSYDRRRERIVLRTFDSVGFVATYVQDAQPGTEIVLVSEVMENVPTGWKARYRLSCPSAESYREVFELDAGRGMHTYVDGRYARLAVE